MFVKLFLIVLSVLIKLSVYKRFNFKIVSKKKKKKSSMIKMCSPIINDFLQDTFA